jgi:hypothetical protein
VPAAKASPHHKWLNKQITNASGVSQVLAFCGSRAGEFDAVNVVTALHRLAIATDGNWDAASVREVEILCDKAALLLHESETRAVANAEQGLRSLSHDGGLVSAMVMLALAFVSSGPKAQDCANICWQSA